MKISKLLPVLCAFAAAGCLTLRAEDNPAQAAARAALANHLFEMAATNTPDTNVVMTPVHPKQSSQDAKAKAKAEKAAAAAKAKQEAADQKAKQEADKKLAEQQAEQKAAQAKAEKAAATAKAKQQAADLKAKQEADKKLAEQQAAQARADKAADAKAKQEAANLKAASQDKMAMDSTRQNSDNQTEAQKAAMVMAADAQTNNWAQTTTNAPMTKSKSSAKAKKQKKQKPAPAAQTAASQPPMSENYAGKELGMTPISGPPPPVSASKVEKLQALLAKYRADQISPEEYQQQRAAIIAAP